MKKLITITEEINLDHIAWEEFSDYEDFKYIHKGKCYDVVSSSEWPLKIKREDGEYTCYRYRRPIEEPKRWFYVTDFTHGRMEYKHLASQVLELVEFDGVRYELKMPDGDSQWFTPERGFEVTDLGGKDYKPQPPLWTHEQLVAFHTKNPHAVWAHINGVWEMAFHSVVNNLDFHKYSLDLGETWHEPKGEAIK